ncbi:glycosyltransferase [Limosilactobacillus fermentum]|uniref:glycosyltransferase n=1 Tax=Limosilactobacillus fermentum TaxID=1613 RepID=UPI0034D4C6ED
MKIVQVIPMFGLAGAETMCENLTMELHREGHHVVVVSLYDYHSFITDRLEKEGIKIYYVGKKRGLDLSIIGKLMSVFSSIKPDVVHSHLYSLKYVTIAAALTGIKGRIHTMHNIATKETTPKNQKLNYFFFHYMHVVPVSLSREIQETVETRYKLNNKQTPVIYNGIDLSKCIVKENYENREELNYLHIGRFSSQKNHKLLIKAFEKVKRTIPEAVLTLVGAGEEEAEIKQLVSSLHLQDSVHFIGLQDNVYPILNQADVFVLSSTYEGMPMTIIEAMGTGLPVVSTNVGGISSMIEDHKEGLLTDVNEKSFANAMIQMRDVKQRRLMGIKGREKANKYFSVETMTKHYVDLYSSRINPKRRTKRLK